MDSLTRRAFLEKLASVRTFSDHPTQSHVCSARRKACEVAEYGAGKNVVENDDLVSEDAFFLVKVIEAVNHPYLHGLPDFANSMMTGNADFNYRALQAMFSARLLHLSCERRRSRRSRQAVKY
jgi:hypothetical protein